MSQCSRRWFDAQWNLEMLGRFLEVSIHTPDIQESLRFYERLGFMQTTVGDTWPHLYAVVTDGRLFLGLHDRECPPIALTYVHAELKAHVAHLQGIGIQFDETRFDAEDFHAARCADPSGMNINILEARTFSPPLIEANYQSTCGYFSELGIPVRDYQAGRDFWESLGFVAMEPETDPFARLPLMADRFDIALYRSRALRQPVLTFEDPDMHERLARLRERKFQLNDEMPDSLDSTKNAVLVAPEGTRLLLLSTND
jgi:catechol 2,3-dioxygenase-like lactoylglutathione lyase family enzyme